MNEMTSRIIRTAAFMFSARRLAPLAAGLVVAAVLPMFATVPSAAAVLPTVATIPSAAADQPVTASGIDLFWEIVPSDSRSSQLWAEWKLIVKSDATERRGGVVENIKVQFTPLPLANHSVRVSPGDSFDHVTGVWTIQSISPGGSAEMDMRAPDFYTLVVDPSRSSLIPRRIHAEIVESNPPEPPDYRDNNEVELWAMDGFRSSLRWTLGDAGVYLGVDNQAPGPGEQVTFTVYARNDGAAERLPNVSSYRSYISNQLDVEVRVDLSPGLDFGPGQAADFDLVRETWSVGDLVDIENCEHLNCRHQNVNPYKTLEVPVVLPADIPLDQIPLEQRCLTATVTQATPLFELDPSKRANDVAKVCLGKHPPVVLTEGEVNLWWLHDCVGDTAPPCGADDDIRLFTRVRHGDISLPSVQRRDWFDILPERADLTYLDPESVIVQVGDPAGRQNDPNSHSLTDATTVSWQTARRESGGYNQDGVWTWYRTEDFSDTSSNWDKVTRTVSVSGLNGATAPGRLKIRFDSQRATTWFDPNPTEMKNPFGLNTSTDFFLEFNSLGTYVVNFSADIPRADSTENPNSYSASADYTFHVGPISELEVRDGGASPLAGTGERAYTIIAANNGPDTAPAVAVSLRDVPQGAEAVLTEGAYSEGTCEDGRCDATWEIGEVRPRPGRIARGQAEFPTLTLIAPANAPAGSITATISNTEDYSVTIDGTVHSTHYFDYVEANNSASITRRFGTAAGDPGTPVVRAQLYPQPPTALVRWDPVERLNLWPVTHYEVWRSVAACHAPGPGDSGRKVVAPFFVDDLGNADDPVCYYVRAVNGPGTPGYWSEPALASGVTRVTPHVSVRGEPAVSEGSTIYFTINAFPAPNAGETLTVNYTVSQQGDVLASGQAGRKQVTVDDQGEVRIFVQSMDDEVDEADGAVTVTLNSGSGYELSSARSASVPVLDDERSEVFFTRPSAATVGENAGRRNIEITIDPAPALPLPITYSVSGTARAGADYRIAGLSGSAGSVTARPGATRVNIPVQIVNDGGGELDETIVLTLSTSDEYDLFSPLTYTLTIEDDDGSGVSFAQEASSVGEADGTHTITVNLAPAATENVTINYTVGGSARSPADYTINGSGSVMAVAGATSVTIPVSIVNDNENEGDEEVALTLRSGAGYTLGANRRHTLTILDNDRPRAAFASEVSTAGEADGARNVRVNLSPAPTSALTLRYGVGGTATRNRDFTMDNYGTVTVQANAASVDIPVTITDDDINEADETVVLTLQAGSGYTLGEREHTLTITDNDQPQVFFAAGDARVVESNGTHRAVITLDPRPHGDIPISYSVSGDAGSPADYTIAGLTGSTGTVTARGGASSVAIPIAINDDRAAESSETVVLTLDAGDGYTVLNSGNQYTLTIEDNDASEVSFQAFEGSVGEADGTHVVTVRLDSALATDTIVSYRAENRGRATRGDDYTISGYGSVTVPAGERTADITLTIRNDNVYEGTEMVILTLTDGLYNVGSPGSYQLTIEDDDPAPDDARVVSFKNPLSVTGSRNECDIHESHGGCRPAISTQGGNLSSELTVVVKYVGGTATLGDDFYFCCGVEGPEGEGELFTITVPRNRAGSGGITLAWIEIRAVSDGRSEPAETATFRLVNGPGYTVPEGDGDFIVTIRD